MTGVFQGIFATTAKISSFGFSRNLIIPFRHFSWQLPFLAKYETCGLNNISHSIRPLIQYLFIQCTKRCTILSSKSDEHCDLMLLFKSGLVFNFRLNFIKWSSMFIKILLVDLMLEKCSVNQKVYRSKYQFYQTHISLNRIILKS